MRIPIVALLVPCILGLAGSPHSSPAADQTGHSSHDELVAKAMSAYAAGDFDAGIAAIKPELKRQDLDPVRRARLYATLSALTYAQGKRSEKEAIAYLSEILDLGPCIIALPDEMWPPNLRAAWYAKLRERSLPIECPPADAEPSRRTLAVMEFENLSAGRRQAELGYLSKGMAELFELEFRRFPSVRLVERDKIDYLLKEIDLAQRGLAEAVAVGKIAGVQVMIFGSLILPPKGDGQMVVKAVDVESTEIIASAAMQGTERDFFGQQAELCAQLARELGLSSLTDTLKTATQLGTSSPVAAEDYSRAMIAAEEGDYARAYRLFKQAADRDADFSAATRAAAKYRPLARGRGK